MSLWWGVNRYGPLVYRVDVRGDATKKFSLLPTPDRQAILGDLGLLGERVLEEGLERLGPPYRLWQEVRGLILLLELDTRRKVLRLVDIVPARGQ